MTEEKITLENQLMQICESKDLNKASAQALVDEFRAAVSLDDDVVARAMAIEVTAENQTGLMEEAREFRLELRAQRIEVENLRKSKKDSYLRIGQAIDGVANHVKGLIEPVESHLKEQEEFVKRLEAKRDEERRVKAEALLKEQEEREAREAAEAEAKRRAEIEAENARLKAEAEEREKAAAKERAQAEKARLAEQEKHAEEMAAERAERERVEAEGKARREKAEAKAERDKKRIRDAAEKKAKAEEAKRDEERRAAEKKATEELAKARAETARLAALVKCPKCGNVFDGREHPGE